MINDLAAMAPMPSVNTLFAGRPTCADEAGTLCAFVYRVTGQAWLADSADWLIAKPLTILLILAIAIVVRLVAHRAIARLVTSTSDNKLPAVLRPLRDRAGERLEIGPLLSERREQRAQTIGSVLRSTASATILTVALLMVLGELGLNLAPLIASAGIVGVALGFGAQNLVKDVLSGMFMILEDQYGVGDSIDVGEATGTVEAVGLRTTRLRGLEGTVWYVRNGEILRVGNMSQGWSRVVLDVPLSYTQDLRRATAVLQEVADEVFHDERFADVVVEEPTVTGVEALNRDGLTVRLTMKTKPEEQAPVARELRARIKDRFDAEGIELPRPPGTMLMAPGTPTPQPPTDPAG
ncbi:MAG: mechanosensitive ion channel family protein [Mycobacteriales bacterium]